jgi:Flp pilus assembly protein TadD
MNLSLRAVACCLLPVACCLASSSCSLFDNTQLEQQRAELARLRGEAEKLKQETETLRQQGQQRDNEREACNRAFSAFEAGKKAGDTEAAVAHYKEGLMLCPNDDVAHNELGELYLRMGRRDEAAAAFRAALNLNANFSRARKNLEATR